MNCNIVPQEICFFLSELSLRVDHSNQQLAKVSTGFLLNDVFQCLPILGLKLGFDVCKISLQITKNKYTG